MTLEILKKFYIKNLGRLKVFLLPRIYKPQHRIGVIEKQLNLLKKRKLQKKKSEKRGPLIFSLSSKI